MTGGKPNPAVLGVLGLALAALATDQFILQAEASGGDASPTGADASERALTDSVSRRHSQETLADRFEPFAAEALEFEHLERAFQSENHAAESIDEQHDVADHANAGVALTAILRRADGDIAVINGRPLRIGQAVDGCRVTAIGERHVELETSVGPITIELSRPALGGG